MIADSATAVGRVKAPLVRLIAVVAARIRFAGVLVLSASRAVPEHACMAVPECGGLGGSSALSDVAGTAHGHLFLPGG